MAENNEGVITTPEAGESGEAPGAVVELTSEQITDLRVKAERVEQLERDLASIKKDYKRVNNKLKEALEPEEKPAEKQQSNEPDYSRIAFLNSIDVKHPEDQKLMMDEASRLKLPLTDIANMAHIKTQLAENLAKRETQAGMPSKSGRTGGSASKDIEYYLNNPNEVPSDPNLHSKVIEARMKSAEEKSMWSSEPFIG